MSEPLLADIFGTNATQTDTTLTISKADLATVGLTALTNNTSESLIASLIKLWSTSLTETNYETNADQSVYLSRSSPALVSRLVNDQLTQYKQDSYTIYYFFS